MSDVTLKRIMDLETQSEVDNSVYTIIDSPTGYGKKFPLGGLVEEVSDLKQDFDQFPNGNYPNMTAGNAEQLVSTVFVEDEVPYNFRTSGGSADIGDREYDEIVGVSMVVNQLCDMTDVTKLNHSECNISSTNGKITQFNISVGAVARWGLANGFPSIDHKVFVCGTVKPSIDIGLRLWNVSWEATALTANTAYSFAYIIGMTIDSHPTDVPFGVATNSGTTDTTGVTVEWTDCMVIDLTLMLGSTIADYVYGLETATAGSGVSWLKHHFPKIFNAGYIPYNAGEMQSVTGLSAHKMTGFNQWDEVWEAGLISGTTGQNVNGTGIRSKNMNRCVPGTSYYYKAPGNGKYVMWYDADENFISPSYIESNGVVTSPSNAAYFRLRIDGITTYSNDICINLHWDGERDGEYEAYKEYVYPLDSDVVLRGIPKLDASNNLYYDGDVYEADGTVTRRFGVVDLGSLNWVYNAPSGSVLYNYFSVASPDDANRNVVSTKSANIICEKYRTVPSSSVAKDGFDKAFASGGASWFIADSAYTDAATFKTAMSGVYLVYELATPTTETAEPYQTPQIVDDWGTEEYISTSLVPVGHDTKYANNLRAKLEMSPDSPEEDGDYIVRHNNGENQYVALGSTTTIQGILDRLTALENA